MTGRSLSGGAADPDPSPSRDQPLRPPRNGRLGLFGGTFDPPHAAHVVAATWVRHALLLDEVWLIPAHRPWQKVADREVSGADDRLAMVRAAVAGIEGLRVSTIEIERGGDSYTVDTLAELARLEPTWSPYLILGGDAAAGLETWERASDVRSGCTVVVVDRPGMPAADPPPGWRFERVDIPRLDISSTMLRDRVAAGEPIDGLVPAAVWSVISQRGLYRGRRI